jgi:hypothetical protein
VGYGSYAAYGDGVQRESVDGDEERTAGAYPSAKPA